MSDLHRRFDPSELDGGDDADLAGLLGTARDLESFAANEYASPSSDFEDRVMAAIAAEPAPRAIAAGGFIATLRNAWRLAWSGSRPMAVRAQAFALLLIVAVALGSVGSLAAVGAARLLSPQVTPPPTLLPSPSPSLPPPSISPSPPPSPTPSVPPSVSPSPTVTVSPTETPESTGSDDHGGGSGSGSGSGSDSGSDSGSGSDDKTAEPRETPEAEETPESSSGSSEDGSGHDR